MLPEIESQATKRKAELERELVQLRERLHKHKTGLQKLQPKIVATTQNSINWRLTELKSSGQKKKKVELKKRIPLYRKGEIWVCANCY
jgi:predicted  nucleic acid-binding Zn-ribbon protein